MIVVTSFICLSCSPLLRKSRTDLDNIFNNYNIISLSMKFWWCSGCCTHYTAVLGPPDHSQAVNSTLLRLHRAGRVEWPLVD